VVLRAGCAAGQAHACVLVCLRATLGVACNGSMPLTWSGMPAVELVAMALCPLGGQKARFSCSTVDPFICGNVASAAVLLDACDSKPRPAVL